MRKIPKSSPALLAFYIDWLAWAEAGAPDDSACFTPGIGLCNNAWYHAQLHGREKPHEVEEELHKQFRAAGRYGERMYYPFGQADYLKRSDNDSLHLCPKRLAWVRARIEEAQE